jgi:two-component system OmpR family sensor kinase
LKRRLDFRKLRPIAAPLLIWLGVIILAVLLWTGRLTNHLITARIDLGNLLCGLAPIVAVPWIALSITSNRNRELSLERLRSEAADEKRRFIRRLDHELKNPLTAIRAGLANLAETRLDETQFQTLSSIESQTLRLSRLSSDLRKLAELESRPLESAPVDLNEMLQEAYAIALDQPNAAGRQFSLNVPRVPWPLPAVQGDRDLLFLAVHNLLDNAIKFTQPGNTIEMRAFEDASSLVIEVADTGQGIPEDEMEHIGEELFRARGARGIPGNGLGLALVNSIINLHGGSVSLRSKENQGTVIALRLPLA